MDATNAAPVAPARDPRRGWEIAQDSWFAKLAEKYGCEIAAPKLENEGE